MMRLALLVTPTYARRPDLPPHAEAEHDERAVRTRLRDIGYDFEVVSLAAEPELDVRIRELLEGRGAGGEAAVLLYISGVVQLDREGLVSLEVEPVAGGEGGVEASKLRVPLSAIRSAVRGHGLRGLAMLFDLVYVGEEDAAFGAEIVATVRRVFAPELSGCAVMCAARSSMGGAPGQGPSPLTALWLRTMDEPDLQNAAGAVLATRVMEAMREDPELYARVPCFSLIGGRRDLALYSVAAASHSLSVPPPPSRQSSPGSMRASIRVQDVLAEADALFRGGRWNEAVDGYKKALLLLGDETGRERADVYVRLAEIKESHGRRREAMISYEKALGIAPTHTEALRNLADAHGAEGDFAAAARMRTRLLDVTDDDEQFGVLLSLAADHEKAKQLDSAIDALERARMMRPEETLVLARLAQVYDSTKQCDKVVDIKVAIAQLKTQDEEVARSLVVAADFAAERAQDAERALRIYEAALDRDPLTPRAFDAQCQILVARSDLRGYERAMVAQSGRLERAGAHAAEAEVWRELATVRRQQLGDLSGAIFALDRCLHRVPSDVEGRVALADLLVEAGEHDAALMSLEIATWHAPGRVGTYRRTFEVASQVGRTDQAYCAAAALTMLGEAELDEQLYFDQYHPDGMVRPTRSMQQEVWDKLYPSGHDPWVGRILGLVAPFAIDFKLDWLRKRDMLPELDPQARQDPETSTVSLTRTFVWASTVLDVPMPEIYVGDEVPGGIAAVPAEVPTALVGRGVMSGKGLKELAFLVGRDISYYRPEHYILVLYPSLKELTALFLAAVVAVRPKLPLPEDSSREAAELAQHLRKAMDEETTKALEAAVQGFEREGGRADLVAWARAIEMAATRAALLLCGDLGLVSAILERDDRSVGDLTAQERMQDILPFSVSGLYASLRTELGVSVG